MIDDVQRLLDRHHEWLKARTSLREVGGWVEITTPYVDRHNDMLQLYAQVKDGLILLTDDSYTVRDLESSGCKLDSPKRQELLTVTLNGFGVQRDGDALVTTATDETFNLRKHNLVQAMLAVGDLFYMAEPVVQSLFLEDVEAWLDANDVRFTERVPFVGKSGFSHQFDFVVPKSRTQPERVLKAVNHPTKQTAEVLAFSWIDTREVRPTGARAYAVLNDAERSVNSEIQAALRSYEISPVLWSSRDDFVEELAS